MQELHSVQPRDKQEFDIALQGTIEEHEAIALANEKHYPYEIDAFASEGFLQFFFEDNPNKSFNVYILDEANHIEIYRHCEGSKEQKIREINHIYQSAGLEGAVIRIKLYNVILIIRNFINYCRRGTV